MTADRQLSFISDSDKSVSSANIEPLVFYFEGIPIRIANNDPVAPAFVANDACEALEIADVGQAISRLDDDERGVCNVPTPGGKQQMVTITESGLYSLILTSRKPAAKEFKRWITHEVLPTIRKTGSYTFNVEQPAIAPPRNRKERTYRDRMIVEKGMTPDGARNQLQVRRDTSETFKAMATEIKAKVGAQHIGNAVNAEYLAFFHRTTAQLRADLDTKSIRDALPPLDLQYLRSAEMSLTALLKAERTLTYRDLLDVIDEVFIPMGELLRKINLRSGALLIGGGA